MRGGCRAAVVCAVLTLLVTVPAGASVVRHAPRALEPRFPMGVFDLHEPSDFAPPGPSALEGYRRVFVDDFTTRLNTLMWNRFAGVPKGDPTGRFERSHVYVRGGVLRIGTWRDPSRGDAWASGGLCLCGLRRTYGAFFVRSRETATGPDDAELLWPTDNAWPPEVDFAETGGASAWRSSWFDHYRPAPDAATRTQEGLDVLHWHTWGVVWTPTTLTFVVDGHVWGEVTATAAVPDESMTLDLQQQTWCGIFPACPTGPSSLWVDWVAVYAPS